MGTALPPTKLSRAIAAAVSIVSFNWEDVEWAKSVVVRGGAVALGGHPAFLPITCSHVSF